MKTYDLPEPHVCDCGYRKEQVTFVAGPEGVSTDPFSDSSAQSIDVCLQCGKVSVIVCGVFREPTSQELLEIHADPGYRRLEEARQEVFRKRN